MTSAPIGLIVFVVVLGIATHMAAHLIASQAESPAVATIILLLGWIVPLVYAVRTGFKRGRESAGSR